MVENSAFRWQAVTSSNLLLEAASLLESSQGSSVGSYQGHSLPRHPQSHSLPLRSGRTPETERPGSASSQSPSVSTELRNLFNWSSSGKNKSRKQKASASALKIQKKAKVHTRTHLWVCLSGTGDESVPDATERVILKITGLGECRFAVDVSATAQELCDVLEGHFPRLAEGGVFELMRSEEGCPRENWW